MSDGITDADREGKRNIERWRKSAIEQLLSTFDKEELIKELCKREGVTSDFTPKDYSKWLGDKWIHGPARILVITE
jgi:serine phosphatase RsbU (regulator of sigma subunit)